MESVGLRELRQEASELVRRVQAGEEITITVSGRPSARLVPARPSQWQQHFDALPVDETVAISYGRLAAAVVEVGRQPRRRVMDLLIAATAHAHGARLCTRNPDDFAGLENLIEITAV
ncbi:MAG: type II toxin-antitoxin system prevent-host-death family antitoxin [Intrasporangiaceae bacterium]|nr:type II toxin-antitoxin system prevent-host-death family antitoxin [Intrasporangiaceae bacterium]